MDEIQKPGNGLADKLLEVVGLVGVVLLIVLPATFYSSLPGEIPTHFGIRGNPDDFGGKAAIWMLPVIGVVLYAGLALVNYFLVRKKMTSKADPATEARQKQAAFRLLQYLKVMLVFSFAYIVFATIQTALGKAEGLGVWFLPAFMVILTGMPVVFLIRNAGSI